MNTTNWKSESAQESWQKEDRKLDSGGMKSIVFATAHCGSQG